jgi:hypothetical protein
VFVLTTRPKVAELTFQLYGRPLHPELFQIYRSRCVDRGNYQAKIDITSAGHVITWRSGHCTLTEVAAAAGNPLPKARRLLCHRLRGEHRDLHRCRHAVYQMNFQLETAEPDIFWTIQQDLLLDAQRSGLVYSFDGGGRMALGAFSCIHVETRERSLLIQAFHTFPEDLAIVKTQSLFELVDVACEA